MQGWIKLHRQLIENSIFDNEKGLKVWIWCLLRANHQKSTILLGRQKVTLNAGEFAMGSKKESEILKIAKSTLWFWLEYLAKEGQLELKKTNKYTIIKVKNWKKYQLLELKSDSNEDADGTQIGTDNNVKKDKNDKEPSAGKPRSESTQFSKDISEVIDSFKEINPSYQKLFKQSPQRQAAQNLLILMGKEKLLEGIKALPDIISQKYAPRITTPVQLENKLGELKVFLQQKSRSGITIVQ